MQQNLHRHSIWRRTYFRLGTVLIATCLVIVLALVIKFVILPYRYDHHESEALNTTIKADNGSNVSTTTLSTTYLSTNVTHTVEDAESYISTTLSPDRWSIDSYHLNIRIAQTTVVTANGQILTCGRYNMDSTGLFTASSCEIYLPLSRKWHTTTTMQVERGGNTLTVLQNDKSILAIGSFDVIDSNTAEIYDIEIDRWTFVPTMMEDKRYLHTATLLQNGQVLIAGGLSNPIGLTDTSSTHLYDPTSNMFIRTGSMNVARYAHIATLSNDGLSVLVTGGVNIFYRGRVPSEIYINGSWFYTNGDMMYDRTQHATALLPDGNVLVAGGRSQSYGILSSAELYNPTTRTFSLTQPMICSRLGFTLTLLPSGQVLAAGGTGSTTDGCPLVSELYDPVNGQWTSTRLLNTIRQGHAAGIVNNSVVLIGGYDDTGKTVDQCETYYL